MPGLRRRVKRRSAVDKILSGDIRACVQKRLRGEQVAAFHGESEGCKALAGSDGLGGGAGCHEKSSDVRAPVDGGDVEGGVASGVPCRVRVESPGSEQR